MNAASRKLTAEDRRTPISRPFLTMAVFVYCRSVWCPMLQETLAEIGEALAEEGWGPQRKLRQICMTVSEFVFDNWATELELCPGSGGGTRKTNARG